MTHTKRFATACLALAMTLVSAPALAQVDLVGNWESWMHEDWADRGLGPEIADMTALRRLRVNVSVIEIMIAAI